MPQQVSVDNFPSLSKPKFKNIEYISSEENVYLNVMHKTSPQSPENPRKLTTKHYLFEDWQVAKSGGVICTNEAMINEQKKVFSHVIKSIGKNIFKSKNILSISLPVTIFKKE
jgi:hypothetical protein